MADRFQVVSPRLLVAQVRVERGVSRGAGQVFALTEGNVLVFGVFVALGETEVDDVDVVLGGFGRTDQEVVRLDISVDNAFLMDFLNSLDLNAGTAKN